MSLGGREHVEWIYLVGKQSAIERKLIGCTRIVYKPIGFLFVRIQAQLFIEIIQQSNMVKLGGCSDKRIYGFVGVAFASD